MTSWQYWLRNLALPVLAVAALSACERGEMHPGHTEQEDPATTSDEAQQVDRPPEQRNDVPR
jgi:hypothetical protein